MLNNSFSKRIARFTLPLLLAASVAMLTACGGGNGSTTGSPAASGVPATTPTTTTTTGTQTITGTVATGAPLVGATITIKDSAGKTASGLSVAGGAFSIAVTGMKPPFMLVSAAAGQSNLYSILPAMDMATTNTQNVNITPVTTLVMYELNGGADPGAMYVGGTFSTATAANVSAKETIVRSKLPANTVNPIFSMMYGKFSATGVLDSSGYDKALDGLGKITTITATGVTFTLAPTYTAAAAGTGAVAGVTAPSIVLALTDTLASFAARTSITGTSPARVTATFNDANGNAVSGAIITFSTSDPRDTFSGGVNTAITNASGVATVTLTTSNIAGGASTVTANSSVATKSLNYSVGASAITLSALSLPAAISAFGTASVSVNVLNNGVPYTTPMTVSFSSACASTGRATLTASVTTVNGTATANYLDNGCNNPAPGDTITATLMNGVASTGNLAISSPLIGSIQFVSVVTSPSTTPVMITLKGTGGAARSETARVTFRVVDSLGNSFSAPVTFSLNTSLGGLSLSALSAVSDPATGYVSTNVQSGTMSTAVRVTATTPGLAAGTTLSTQSDQLVISTGIPAQDSFSLSATAHNIEGWNWDGTTTTLTTRLADHFHNPVPDGTAVYFTSEGGSVTPSCTTVGGVCSAVLTSQALRPTNGRVTVLARAIGEEAFTDLNSNGVADPGEMIDANGAPTDMGEAYVDFNENGKLDNPANPSAFPVILPYEPFIDFNGNGIYDGTTTGVAPFNYVGATSAGDSHYQGVLCNATANPTFCSVQKLPDGSTQKSIDVRGSQVFVFSTSDALITLSGPNPSPGIGVSGTPGSYTIALPTCLVGAPVSTYKFTVTVLDLNGNAMPAGTTVAFAATNGIVTVGAGASYSYVVPDTIACRSSTHLVAGVPVPDYPGCPASAGSTTFGDTVITISDASLIIGGVCIKTTGNGNFTVTVTSPKGRITTAIVPVTN